MTKELTANEREFVNRMTQGKKYASWGFDLLLKQRPNTLDNLFDLIKENGLFLSTNNLGQIPSWPALEYLAAVAKIADKQNDNKLAEKILAIVRAGSKDGNSDIRSSDNFYACHMFAKIIGLVPITAIDKHDIELIPLWLGNEFDTGTTAKELSDGILCRTLDDNSPRSLEMACQILNHCTAIKNDTETEAGSSWINLKTVVDDYWLEQILNKHIPTFVEKTAEETAVIFIKRLKQIFASEKSYDRSNLKRPAIEDHPQNHRWAGPVNHFVEALRNVLSQWVVQNSQAAHAYIDKLKDDKTGIIRRIVLHTLNHNWAILKDTYNDLVSIELFQDEYLHEMYELIRTRFPEMNQEQRDATLQAIRNIPEPNYCEEAERKLLLMQEQHRWLSAIPRGVDHSVDRWFAKLNDDKNIGKLSPHPSFSSYTESWRGPGPSAYSVDDLIVETRNGTLIETLNSFDEKDSWRGPTIHALADTLAEAIKKEPQLFLSVITKFLCAHRPYQYGFINGYKQLWGANEDNLIKSIDWNETWENLIDFFDQLLSNDDFWAEKVISGPNLTPNRDWIAPAIAEFLHAGTRDDNHSFPPALLSRAWKLIWLMLNKVCAESEVREDAMFQAINSPKGKVIEALFSHTLRACRVSDKENGNHEIVWDDVEPVFNRELALCKGTNFEFSTLAGAYLPNLAYINHKWLRENILHIFPKREYIDNCVCALNGLAHAPASRPVYSILIEAGIVDQALQMDLRGEYTREILVQRIGSAFLLGDEEIDGPRFNYLLDTNSFDDLLCISDHFSNYSSSDLESVHIERILLFWKHIIDWCRSLDEPPEKLLSTLSVLICYLEAIDDDNLKRLIYIAPYLGYDGFKFITELERLCENYPNQVLQVFDELSKYYFPSYDHNDRLKSFIKKVADHSTQGKIMSIRYVDKLANRGTTGMREIYDVLSADMPQ